ncbi:hypothetical protein TRV_06700 [Trichophyton verrucosum HKI 0517]|uniref:Uncharacterized protein n=1 Tax=Trichophyton verrucosum (strain HKI 0517) TaxID=663202 RepID=D4DHP4_TRIVH|nr:uncharacterized protein TRV_06700 [Trichophyton verrucosum HKI 0517]EFE38651.1 hypothetical protein TRV_06700 [Trichophyton verrucosum HKI 0517]
MKSPWTEQPAVFHLFLFSSLFSFALLGFFFFFSFLDGCLTKVTPARKGEKRLLRRTLIVGSASSVPLFLIVAIITLQLYFSFPGFISFFQLRQLLKQAIPDSYQSNLSINIFVSSFDRQEPSFARRVISINQYQLGRIPSIYQISLANTTATAKKYTSTMASTMTRPAHSSLPHTMHPFPSTGADSTSPSTKQLSVSTLSLDIQRAMQSSSSQPKYISAGNNDFEHPPPPPPSPVGFPSGSTSWR